MQERAAKKTENEAAWEALTEDQKQKAREDQKQKDRATAAKLELLRQRVKKERE